MLLLRENENVGKHRDMIRTSKNIDTFFDLTLSYMKNVFRWKFRVTMFSHVFILQSHVFFSEPMEHDPIVPIIIRMLLLQNPF